MAKRISETELILPALYLMSLNGGTISTSDLIVKLRAIIKPSGTDLDILSGRKDDKFSQKVRNLKAHDTFERFGYALYGGPSRNGSVTITDAGKRHLESNKAILTYLLVNDFSYDDIKVNLKTVEANNNIRQIQTFDENIIIQEGIKKYAQVAVYQRSSLLRNTALDHFTVNGHIPCSCCNFDFENFYGPDGKGFIEIHHTKPIFTYADEDINRTIQSALNNLTPVCSNCHRMIHRNWSKPLEVQALLSIVNQYGVYP